MKALLRQLHAAFHEPATRIYRITQGTVWALILLSILLLVVDVYLPEGSAWSGRLRDIDRAVLVIFAVEILARVLTYQPPSLQVFRRPRIKRIRTHVLARLAYMMRPIMLVDLLAVLALFPGFRGLRALRLLRLLRTMRVFQYRNPFAILLHALEENGLLFAFAFSVLGATTLLGGVSLYLVEVRVNPSLTTLTDGFWWALVTITTVGYGDVTPVTGLGRIIGAVMMIAGMFTLALFAGFVGSSLVKGMLSIREEQFRMSGYVNHIVVCGFDESTDLLTEALRREIDTDETRVVIIDDHERPRELPTDILWVQGDATKESELDKVRITQAAAVIVSGARDMGPQAADARTILTIFTLRAFLERHREVVRQRRKPLYIVAEILDAENVDHARAAGADEVIETRKIGYSMIAHAVTHHGTATTISDVLMSGSQNVYIGRIPDLKGEKLTLRELLARMQLTKQGGLVIGVRTPSGEEVINPPGNYPVTQDLVLVYLATEPLLKTPR